MPTRFLINSEREVITHGANRCAVGSFRSTRFSSFCTEISAPRSILTLPANNLRMQHTKMTIAMKSWAVMPFSLSIIAFKTPVYGSASADSSPLNRGDIEWAALNLKRSLRRRVVSRLDISRFEQKKNCGRRHKKKLHTLRLAVFLADGHNFQLRLDHPTTRCCGRTLRCR